MILGDGICVALGAMRQDQVALNSVDRHTEAEEGLEGRDQSVLEKDGLLIRTGVNKFVVESNGRDLRLSFNWHSAVIKGRLGCLDAMDIADFPVDCRKTGNQE